MFHLFPSLKWFNSYLIVWILLLSINDHLWMAGPGIQSFDSRNSYHIYIYLLLLLIIETFTISFNIFHLDKYLVHTRCPRGRIFVKLLYDRQLWIFNEFPLFIMYSTCLNWIKWYANVESTQFLSLLYSYICAIEVERIQEFCEFR